MIAAATLNPSSLPQTEAIGYSQIAITQTGRLAFVSGQVAITADSQAISKNFDVQADVVIENLSHALSALGVSEQSIVQLRIYVVDLTPTRVETVMNRLAPFLKGTRPSLTGVGVSSLASPDFLLEIEMIVQLSSA